MSALPAPPEPLPAAAADPAPASALGRPDRQFERAVGSVLIDTEGRRYIDFHSGGGLFQYGHNDPELCEALMRHVRARGLCGPAVGWTEARARFLDHLAQDILRPRNLGHRVQWAGASGREALVEAMRVAREVTGRERVLCFSHGRSVPGAAMRPTFATPEARRFAARAGVTHLPYDDLGDAQTTLQQIDAVLGERPFGIEPPAAVLVETLQIEGALDVARASWLKRLAEVVHRHGALLIVDEGLAGCGRTGAFFSFEDFGLQPDLIVLSTPASGFGLPMGLLLVDPGLQPSPREPAQPLLQGSDHAFVTGAAAMQKFWSDDRLSQAIARRARWMRQTLQAVADQVLPEVVPNARIKGRGLALGLDLRSPELARRAVRLAMLNGLVVDTCQGQPAVLRLMPALNVPDLLLEQGLDMIRHVVGEAVRQHRAAGRRAPVLAHEAPTLTVVVSPPMPAQAAAMPTPPPWRPPSDAGEPDAVGVDDRGG